MELLLRNGQVKTEISLDSRARDIVRRGYEACAEAYAQARAGAPLPELDLLTALLPRNSRVLDIGCGCGVPVTAGLAERFEVTGVDLCPEQIRRARAAVPRVHFVTGDIMEVAFGDGAFDAAVAFYSVFHVPRGRHAMLFDRIARWLAPDGYLLMTLTDQGEPGYTEADFFGTEMYWSHYGLDTYRRMLAEAGFDVLQTAHVGHGYPARPDLPAERHLLVLARRLRRHGD